jgi:hypothetical protein
MSRSATISTLAICFALNVAPAKASTVTDFVTFTDIGSYPINGDRRHRPHGYQGETDITVSFDITFDPTKLYLTQSITGFITDLSVSITDPYFSSSPLKLDDIKDFAYDGGTLTLSSLHSLSKTFRDSPNITIGINAWSNPSDTSDVWYSQHHYRHTLTSSGDVEITVDPTPLPPAWTMMLIGLAGLGFAGYRGSTARLPIAAA